MSKIIKCTSCRTKLANQPYWRCDKCNCLYCKKCASKGLSSGLCPVCIEGTGYGDDSGEAFTTDECRGVDEAAEHEHEDNN